MIKVISLKFMFKILKYLKPLQIFLAILALIFVVIQVAFDLTLPDFMAEITRLAETPNSEMNDILIAGAKMILCATGSLIASVLTAICASKVAVEFAGNIRQVIFRKVSDFSMSEIKKFSTASLITRSTNDIQQIQMFIVLGFQMLIKAPIMAIWAIAKISGKQFEWTLATAVAVIIILISVLICVKIAIPYFKKTQYLIDNVNRIARENLQGLSVVHAYNAEEFQQNRFEKANVDLTNNQLSAQRALSFLMPTIQSGMNGLSMAIYWIGGCLINGAALTDRLNIFSDMMVYSQYAIQVIMSFMMLVMIFMLWPRASVAANRINEIIDTKVIVNNPKSPLSPKQSGIVEFRDVTFQYPDAEDPVISHISFVAQPGTTVAFIGSTGSGKSTVVNLIPRFYDVSDGEILVDGANVKDFDLNDLRNRISYIPQSSILFEGTIESNLNFGSNDENKISDEDINRAIETSQSDLFLSEKENGILEPVAQGGSNFSGGQKQRLSIARGLARNPEIIIFDDTFSALDFATDAKLRHALEKNYKNATKLIVAQRIGTIRNADQIIVLDEGKMVGCGTHDQLMDSCEVYKQIALSQLDSTEV